MLITPGQKMALLYAGIFGHEFVVLRPANRGDDTWDKCGELTTEERARSVADEHKGAVVLQRDYKKVSQFKQWVRLESVS